MDDMECETCQYEHYLAAERARRNLSNHIDKLTQLAQGSDVQDKLRTTLDAAEQELASQANALEGVLAQIAPQSRRSPDTAALLDKLSSTPELLELILMHLSNSELLRCMQVNKLFLDAITSSARIQRKMGLRADTSGTITFPTHDFWFSDLFCSAEAMEPKTANSDEPSENLLRVYVAVDTFPRSFHVGERCRSMLICQPPLKTINAFTSCCAGPRFWRHRMGDDRPPAEVLNSENGITVGDILDATARLKESHRLCPDASPFDHNADGFVNAQVSFEAAVKADASDPLFVREREKMHEDRRKHRERVARQHRIDAYTAAKRGARDRGEPIPTLEQFEVASTTSAG